MNPFNLFLPRVSPERMSVFSRRYSLRSAAAVGAAFAALLFAAAPLTAREVDAPTSTPARNAPIQTAVDTGVAEVVTHDYEWVDKIGRGYQ